MTTTQENSPAHVRVDGRAKVTGQALYTADHHPPGLTHAVLVGATVPSGRVTGLDTAAASAAPGVLLVLTPANRGRLGQLPDGTRYDGWPPEARPPLADDTIHRWGQYIALVVAETLEQAQYGASLVRARYETAPFATALDDATVVSRPEQVMGEPMQISRGDPDTAWADAPVRLDVTYTSPNNHPCALEPHATVAEWDGETLLVHDSTQWVRGDQAVLSAAFGLAPEAVRVRAPYVGGMFGSKIATGSHTILAALAARRIGRPVKIVLTRKQVLTNVGHRSETVQRMRVGAGPDGSLAVLRHDTRTHAAVNEDGNPSEFHEPTSTMSRLLYDVPAYSATHESARLNVMAPGWMRAPGEATCQWALESTLDELAYEVGADPLELRRRNHAGRDPHHDLPWSSKHLLECYEQGARRFGWDRRPDAPRSLRDGPDLIGWGMATATYPGWRFGATARVRLSGTAGGPRATVSTSGSEVGNGAYTMLAMTAAEGLGLPVERVTVELGDTGLPPSAQTGGSSLTVSTAPAVRDACLDIRVQLARLAGGRPNMADGDLLAEVPGATLTAEASTSPLFLRDGEFAYQSFGAHFVEVRVRPEIGRIRVSRVVSVFDVGRVLNATTARSQFIGAIIFGIGQALHENLIYDPVHGLPVNADLGGYLVPVNADVPAIDVSWIGAPDLAFNPLGCRGLGEIGITGMAPAIGNAVFHATGVRVRSLPISPAELVR
ncbi:xanthine dehydrogenase family protein molybdopterin-binding subunit [Actinoplanes sp. NEAU-A12]|uniref:Xanthine dehydrogenase family protein molybdopterin-binding subunit n=1 Tax=Actinoplanes sandaracinus TaxID=3045177 RepID=A0ABT6WL49_9ACTN|nr:xanthine dehydrogenase family protein molybdopterin-binding subunit [Actinoplanes sandaracinus]MDI6100452.1 xanthine dehydrogenase family protein molybdopterin-binding subunit [Actinoplanes sandaracinus]